MRITKPVLYTLLSATVLVGCKSISKIPVPQGSTVAVVATAKKAPLTEIEKQNWGHFDLEKDSIPGMSVNKAYEFLGGKKGETVVVAVVDAGTDLEHEDLKPNAWVNPKEIPGNNKDDDKNGFIDDVHGWNFLGKIYKENMELYRIMKDTTIADAKTLARAKKEYNKKVADAKKSSGRYSQILQSVSFAHTTIAAKLETKEYKKEDLNKLDASDMQLKQAIAIANSMYDLGISPKEAIDELKSLIKGSEDLTSGAALKHDYRKVLKDNENSMVTKVYGDANVLPSVKKESHGTHVSGIIGAYRYNKAGMYGVADNVKIMSVRVVPDGDEYDKDVALGIRYAVDNGAKVINTSFGKGYSPQVQWVYDAIKYAEKHDVLIVNAAGNSGKNIDENLTFPNDTPDNVNEIVDNMINVGAMSSNYNEKLPASFSNYGKNNVDVFAPGVKVYSTTPENKYAYKNGTSMAAPSTAGVAAMIRSQYPKLTASQVKHILMNSGTKIDIEVVRPGSVSRENPNGVKVKFSELSKSGRVVNAYNALKMADAMVNGK